MEHIITQPTGPDGCDNIKYKIWNPVDHVGHGFVNGKDKYDDIWTVESLDLGAGEPKTYTIRNAINLKDFGLTDEKEKELNDADCSSRGNYISHQPQTGLPFCGALSTFRRMLS